MSDTSSGRNTDQWFMPSSSKNTRVSNAWNLFGWLICAVNLLLYAKFCSVGLDLTDEGFALNWIRDPWEYSFSLTAAGFLFHPLALLFPDNIVAWRICGAALLLASSFCFHGAIFRYAAKRAHWPVHLPSLVLLCNSVSCLTFYGWWLPTPSYNLLNLVGSLIFMSGLLEAAAQPSSDKLSRAYAPAVPVSLLAMGAVAVWMARPTTLPLLTVIALIWIASHRSQRVFLICVFGAAAATAISLIIAIVMDGSLVAFVHRYQLGFQIIGLLRPPFLESTIAQFSDQYSTGEWLQFGALTAWFSAIVAMASGAIRTPRVAEQVAIIALLAGLPVGIVWETIASERPLIARMAPLALVAALVAVRASRLTWDKHAIAIGGFLVSFLFVLLFVFFRQTSSTLIVEGLLCSGLWFAWMIERPFGNDFSKPLAAAALICWAPVAFGFGSGNPIEVMVGLASTFWVGAAVLLIIVFFPFSATRVSLLLGVEIAMITTANLVGSAFHPYRLVHPLWEQQECIEIGLSNSKICLDHASAEYFQNLTKQAYNSGFAPHTPVIDLSGTAPSTIFALGGTPIGSPWLLGGYPKSEEFAREALETVPRHKLEQAWVLSAPHGHRPIPEAVMGKIGLNFPAGYEEVVRVHTKYENEVHVLWKPK